MTPAEQAVRDAILANPAASNAEIATATGYTVSTVEKYAGAYREALVAAVSPESLQAAVAGVSLPQLTRGFDELDADTQMIALDNVVNSWFQSGQPDLVAEEAWEWVERETSDTLDEFGLGGLESRAVLNEQGASVTLHGLFSASSLENPTEITYIPDAPRPPAVPVDEDPDYITVLVGDRARSEGWPGFHMRWAEPSWELEEIGYLCPSSGVTGHPDEPAPGQAAEDARLRLAARDTYEADMEKWVGDLEAALYKNADRTYEDNTGHAAYCQFIEDNEYAFDEDGNLLR